ncbi:NAD(P)H-dependent glycerol-3-phosphate dehydrogenase [Thermovirga lienii]|uniref:NAD(P)H-dependent glycerol-3-phosphate dehydrogenase n=1 Tax=Thermovirga lienii TaxID=336261 RepID=UPI000EC605B2|nr:glycerol-3-phosphate dehydrogenase [Thermovirga lienii]
MDNSITVFGAGSWGTALASHLSHQGEDVTLWCRRPEQAKAINMTGRNPDYLKNIDLPERLTATSDLEEACSTDTFILAVPTQSVRSFLKQAKPFLREGIHLCNAAKGLEISTGKRISEIVAEIIPSARYSIISGPSHAEEVALSKPTAVVVASIHEEERTLWQNLLNRGFFRVYTSSDVIGVEIGGAVKNVIAIAAGIASEMDLGDNAMAALVSRGLAEVMRLGAKAGAHPLTFAGLAGIGDLMVTCYSNLSRNYRLGRAIAKGMTLEGAQKSLGQVAEGAYTVRALVEHAKELGVELPIAEAVYRVLYEQKTPISLLEELFSRCPKPEMPPEIRWVSK